MKRLGCIGLTIMICAGMLAGCGSSLEADTNTVYVSKHGKVVSMDVEQLDQSYYDETELKELWIPQWMSTIQRMEKIL